MVVVHAVAAGFEAEVAEVLVEVDLEVEDLAEEDSGAVAEPLDLEVELVVRPLEGLDRLE